MKHSFTGLTDAEVEESRKKFGGNDLSPFTTASFWDKLLENFKDPIIIILIGALIIILGLSFFGLSEWYEGVAIAVAVVLATLVSTLSEYKNESSFQKLQEEASKIHTNVFRNDQLSNIAINDIVVGDYVMLQAGDKVPADGSIVEGDLKINQSSLTGESESVDKVQLPIGEAIDKKDLADDYSLFRGSVVDDGEATMLVGDVGDHTFYGGLAKELSITDERLSPLQVKLKDLAKLISKFGYIAGVAVFVTALFMNVFVQHGFDMELIKAYVNDLAVFLPDVLDALILAIIIVVAAVPEGLPMMIAIVLSLNMQKLLKENVLVRRLLGIETAGSINILFSDKTGTITKGQLKSSMVVSADGDVYKTYAEIPEALRELISISILENTSAYLSPSGEILGGNSSERALIEFVDNKDIERIDYLGVVEEKRILFNSAWKFSATQVKNVVDLIGVDINSVTLVKGAPEVLLKTCSSYFKADGSSLEFSNNEKQKLTNQLDDLADKGIRLIALAVSLDPIKDQNIPENSILVGVIGISDEVRDESKFAIENVQKAGIQVVMITGDRKGTAVSISEQVGLLQNENDKVIVSSELNDSSDDEVKEYLKDLRVIGRALPTDKSRLVRLSKSLGMVVGMTGDGVNDSAALKQADVGVAMGSGSEVSKEAGDIVILDDNFNSISNAIRYGRTIFKSIRKFIVFQLTVNVAAVSTVFFGPLVGINLPLTIIQLLWINIIMDTLAAIAFGGEPALERYMEEDPVDRTANILTGYMKSAILTSGIFIMIFCLFFITFDPFEELFVRNGAPNQEVYLTAFFNLFIFLIIFNAFNVRTEKMNLFDHIGQNKIFLSIMVLIFALQIIFTYIGGTILRVAPLNVKEWALVFVLALTIIPLDLLRKFIWFRTQRSKVGI
ncbi:MAG: calcium-translocating P-type ATPase, PMCA-type [Bacteroidetes bacterium]|nr:calcium-translocating P-type ATPase, PMCA-type [Bacteroidota bacterium]